MRLEDYQTRLDVLKHGPGSLEFLSNGSAEVHPESAAYHPRLSAGQGLFVTHCGCDHNECFRWMDGATPSASRGYRGDRKLKDRSGEDLLTTVEVTNHFQAERAIRNYFPRRAVETLSQFVRQETGLEDFGARNFNAIRRVSWIGYCISAWLPLLLERGEKYVRAIIEKAVSVRTRAEPDFRYCRLVWGLRAIVLANKGFQSGQSRDE